MTLLEKQKAHLEALNKKANDRWENHPYRGHGFTPIVENSTGRSRRRQLDKYNDASSNLYRQIKEQEEKIERTERRMARNSTPTKKAEKFISENPISPILFALEKAGKVKQWPRKPQLFFVVGLNKTALFTLGGRVALNAKYPAKTKEDQDYCNALIASAEAEMAAS